MTRIVVGVLFSVALASCMSPGRTADAGAASDAQVAKKEMDAAARDLLPDLLSTLGGDPSGLQAKFYERGGFGLWDYVASGVLSRPLGTVSEKLDKATTVLEAHGYAVERDDEQRRVSAKKDDIGVIVQAGMRTNDPQVTSLNLRIANVGAIDDGDDFAETAPAEDYLAYLK